MTTSRSIKSLVRSRIAITGEPYTLGLRQVETNYRPTFSFGVNPEEKWSATAPHVLFSTGEQFMAFFEARYQQRLDLANDEDFVDAGFAHPSTLQNKPELEKWDIINQINQRVNISVILSKEQGSSALDKIFFIEDLAALAAKTQNAESIAYWLNTMANARAMNVTVLAMSPSPLPADSPFLEPFRVVGEGYSPTPYDATELMEASSRVEMRYSLAAALAYTSEVPETLDLAITSHQDRFLRLARARFVKSEGDFPNW